MSSKPISHPPSTLSTLTTPSTPSTPSTSSLSPSHPTHHLQHSHPVRQQDAASYSALHLALVPTTQNTILIHSLSALLTWPSPSIPTRPKRRLAMTCLLSSLILSLATALVLFVAFHLAIGRLVFTQLDRSQPIDHLINRALVIDLPDRVLLQHIGQQSVSLSLDARLSLDVRRLLGWENKDSGSPWARLEASCARAFVARSPHATLLLPRPLQLRPASPNATFSSDAQQMLLIALRGPLRMPLAHPSDSQAQPTTAPVSLSLHISFPSPDTLARFLARSWHDHRFSLAIALQDVHIQLDGDAFGPLLQRILRRRSATTIARLHSRLSLNLPQLPPLLAHLPQTVRIDHYGFHPLPAPDEGLAILATASLANPLFALNQLLAGRLHVNLPIPWPFPLAVMLDEASGERLMATADTRPFRINTHAARLAVTIEGRVAPQGEGSAGALSGFLNRYLHGLATNVTVRSGSATEVAPEIVVARGVAETQTVLGEPRAGPPAFLERLLADMAIRVAFPGAKETQLVSDLRVEEMRIGLSGTQMTCSGTIMGELKLPKEMEKVVEVLSIDAIKPDVFLIDGPILTDGGGNNLTIDTQDHYPPNAFGRLVTPNYVPSKLIKTRHNSNSTNHYQRTLVAEIDKVPIQVLPGREHEFRKFVGKYLLSIRNRKANVLVSVFGKCQAKGSVGGGVGEIEIKQLQVWGTFLVGGRG